MRREELKLKASKLLIDAERIRIVLEGFKGNYKQTIMPDIRRSVLNDVEILELKIMKDVSEQTATIDSFMDDEEEEVWIYGILTQQSSHAEFFATKLEKDIAEELVKKRSTEREHYLRPEIFKQRMSVLKNQISNGELDQALFGDPSLLIHLMM